MTKYILSVDGGGIRGVGPAKILSRLDQRLKAAGMADGVAQAFDMFVGTSTGCIIAAGLAASGQIPKLGKVTPDVILGLYHDRGKEMFVASGWSPVTQIWQAKYKTSAKNQVLQNIYGPLKLGDLGNNFLGTFYSMGPQPGAVFAQGGPVYRARPDHNIGYNDILLSDVVNASSNAPMYFDPWPVADGKFFGVDGGIFANNPAVCAFIEGRKMFPNDKLVVVSIGCGNKPTTFPDWKTWGLLRWASPINGVPLLEAIFDAQATTMDAEMKLLLDEGRSYFRFQYDLSSTPAPIDDVSPANMKAIEDAADAFLAQPAPAATLDSLVKLLTASPPAKPRPAAKPPALDPPAPV